MLDFFDGILLSTVKQGPCANVGRCSRHMEHAVQWNKPCTLGRPLTCFSWTCFATSTRVFFSHVRLVYHLLQIRYSISCGRGTRHVDFDPPLVRPASN